MREDRNNMEQNLDTRQQQIELLSSVVEYIPKAVAELKKLSLEFYGIKQDDSDEYLDFVLESSNWLIQALNATLDLINEEETVIDREQANEVVRKLNDALTDKVDGKIADALENGLIPILEKFGEAAKKITG